MMDRLNPFHSGKVAARLIEQHHSKADQYKTDQQNPACQFRLQRNRTDPAIQSTVLLSRKFMRGLIAYLSTFAATTPATSRESGEQKNGPLDQDPFLHFVR